MRRFGRTVKWLIIGLEVPALSLGGLLIGLRLSGDTLDLQGLLGMVAGGTMGLIVSSLILYYIATRTYVRDRQAVRGIAF